MLAEDLACWSCNASPRKAVKFRGRAILSEYSFEGKRTEEREVVRKKKQNRR